MREKINRLARGILDTEVPEVILEPDSIDLSVRSGGTARIDILVSSGNDVPLKGLAYSDSIRVRLSRSSFGGLRNRLTIEADFTHLSFGDSVSGSLSFVTNGGEKKLPFIFRVTNGPVGETIGSLDTIERFALIAKTDRESALRLFAYREFINAPFLKDMRLNALYEAFRTGPDRAGALEEFLVAAGMKRPAAVRISEEPVDFGALEKPSEGHIALVQDMPGHFSLSVRAEGAFIALRKKRVTEEDFRDGRLDYVFDVDPAGLHAGLNAGAVIFTSEIRSVQVSVTAEKPESEAEIDALRRRLAAKRHFLNFAKDRFRLALGTESVELLCRRMEAELKEACELLEQNTGEMPEDRREKMKAERARSILLRLILCRAECAELAGNMAFHDELLAGIRDEVTRNRRRDPYTYLFLEYLNVRSTEDSARREPAVKLMRQFLTELGMHEVFPFIAGLDENLTQDVVLYAELIRNEYALGNRSPWLFLEYLKLLERQPALFTELGAPETAALSFGLRYGSLPGALYERAAALALRMRAVHPVQVRLLKNLYGMRPSKDMLSAVCTALIKSDDRSEGAHEWYEKGLGAEVRITGLYEYIVHSMPEGYDHCLPKEVLVYFAYGSMLDDRSRTRLYENIILYLSPETKLWQEYRPQIERFTLDQLLAGKMGLHLSVLYSHVICEDMIDRRMAGVLPTVLNARRINVKSPYIRSVVTVYPELKGAVTWRLDKGTAYVPLFTDDAILLFEDAYGNRYANIPYTRVRVSEQPGLLKRCYELLPGHPMLRISRLKEIAAGETHTAEELSEAAQAVTELKLSELFRRKLLKLTVSDPAAKADFILTADKSALDQETRVQAAETLIRAGYCGEASDMIRTYGCDGISREASEMLCERLILDRMFTEDPVLLTLAVRAVKEGSENRVILDYLCEHYNGTAEEMLTVAERAWEQGIGTYDLEERLLAQLMFTGRSAGIDRVFDRYSKSGNVNGTMVRAYFTLKCGQYFMDDVPADPAIFDALEKTMRESGTPEKEPLILRLSLTRHYAEAEDLNEEQKEMAERLLGTLLDEGLIFPYYKGLARFIRVPADVMDRSMIAYRGRADSRCEMRMRILPDETEFRTEEMKNMFQGIFVTREILFSGETWEYEIYETGADGRFPDGPCAKGSVMNTQAQGSSGGSLPESRFRRLNELTAGLKDMNAQEAKAAMASFASDSELAERLFTLYGE